MGGGDEFLRDVARHALLTATATDLDTVRYRQGVLGDCLRNPGDARALYALAVTTLDRKRRGWLGVLSRAPSAVVNQAVAHLQMLLEMLVELRTIADRCAPRFSSEGFTALFERVQRELDDAYLERVQAQLTELRLRRGTLLSARLGDGNEGVDHVLRRDDGGQRAWKRLFARLGAAASSFRLHPRDDAGARILAGMVNEGLEDVANALAASADHVQAFFVQLRSELAFYVGCLNLHDTLAARGQATCLPDASPAGNRDLRFTGLTDPCLALHTSAAVVGNTIEADGTDLIVVTGANQGGKTVFLRSLGVAQTMMQSGMFVAAEAFRSDVCSGLFTHFRREEDPSMAHGKLDEELARLSALADRLGPDAWLLCNESFAATNQREGSEIARQVVSALLERRVRMAFVTHLTEFALELHQRSDPSTLFLRADRLQDGTRTFHLVAAPPLETGFGEDVYREVFESYRSEEPS
ncbi:MAG: DNA mismatch repair protein MutS [Trueperaceae bacterium]|nr:MAG: DNA mismatch repair protein MutS [Trueperaceae bacterium]